MLIGIIILSTGCCNGTTAKLEDKKTEVEDTSSNVINKVEKNNEDQVDDNSQEDDLKEVDNSKEEDNVKDQKANSTHQENKTNPNCSASLIIDKETLLGTWQASNSIGDGSVEMFSFGDDGNFTYSTSEYDIDRMLISCSGKWVIDNNDFLTVTIDAKTVIDNELGEREYKEIILETPEEKRYSLSDLETTDIDRFPLTMKIDNDSYWKIVCISNVDLDKIDELTKNKIAEFKEAVSKAEQNMSNENLVKAFIIGKVLEKLYIEQTDRKWIEEKKKFLEYRLGSFSLIYTGISPDYEQFTALIQPQMTNSYDFTEAVNSVANDDDEMDMLDDISYIEPEGYFAIDLYVEDLLDTQETIQIDNLRLDFDDGNTVYMDEDIEEVDRYLKDYDRKMKKDLTLDNKSWNLYIFKKTEFEPNEITIYESGQVFHLKKDFIN